MSAVQPRSRSSSCTSTPVAAEGAGSPPTLGRPQNGTEARRRPRGKAATGCCHRKAGPEHQHAAVPSPLSRLTAAIAEPCAAFAKAAVSKPSFGCSRRARGLVAVGFWLDPWALRRLGGEGLTKARAAS